MSHTPGPWTVGTEWQDDIEIHAGPLIVGAAYSDYNGFNGPPYESREANARLIAAAPEMLAMLRRLADAADSLAEHGNLNFADDAIDEARALLAKIDGGAA